MSRWDLHDVEFVGVPYPLRGYAHGLLFDLIGYMRASRPILPDEHVGGLLVSEEQPAYHLATARLVNRPNDPEHPSMLRFVDHKATPESGFPARLFAAHVMALASRARTPARRAAMFRTALALVPPSDEPETEDPRGNANNWSALFGLGNALLDLGRVDEGLDTLSRAAQASPRAMRSLAEYYREAIGRGEFPPPEKDPRSRFWSTLGT
jgi:tetratricopeptide (TPR) repeat protein